jgi:hypothetical protein
MGLNGKFFRNPIFKKSWLILINPSWSSGKSWAFTKKAKSKSDRNGFWLAMAELWRI